MTMIATTPFDAAEYLNSPERQTAYLSIAFEDGCPDFIRDAISIVERARQMSEITKKADRK
jgi:DNA-binding phage protein